MDAYAITKYIKQSSKKVRKTLKLVKGKNVEPALNILHFSKEKAAYVIE